MARPRQAEDAAILAAAARLVARDGPLRMRLADVAAEVGVTASALVQRFGSKRDLLLALASAGAADVEAGFRAARRAHPGDPLAALGAALAGGSRSVATPREMANALAFLQVDLTDDAFHRATLAFFRRWRAEVRALLSEAVEAGELAPTDLDALARAVEVTYNGSLLTWAIRREGRAPDAIRRDLAHLLGPHRRVPMP